MYAQIYSLTATPSPAGPGTEIEVVLIIQNNYSSPISLLGDLTFAYGGVTYAMPYDTLQSDTVDPGYTLLMMGHFTMPNAAVTITAHSYWYGSDGQWHLDQTQTLNVGIANNVPPAISNFGIDSFVKV